MKMLKYHTKLANYFQTKPLYLDGESFKKPNVRKLVEQPWQEMEAAKVVERQFEKNPAIKEQREKLWDNVTNTLCNLDFIQAKAAAKLTYDLVNEINNALEVIPDNAKEIAKEKTRQARMDKYTQDLIACAEGKISRFELEVPESITPWTEEQINAEIERIRTNPNRADKLKDFKNFLGQEVDNLQTYAHEFAHFAIQQAWNFSDCGPVGKAAELMPAKNTWRLLLRFPLNRPSWEPLPQILRIMRKHKNEVKSLSITTNGRLMISGSEDKTCILWDLEIGMPLKTLKGHTDIVNSVAITADGKMAISGSQDKTCILWDLESGLPQKVLKGHMSSVEAVDITPNGKIAITGSSDKTCILWDLRIGIPLKTLNGHTDIVNSVAITADGKRVLSGGGFLDRTCIIWDLKNNQQPVILKEHTESVNTVAVTSDGKFAISGSSDNSCIFWDIETGNKLKHLKVYTGGFYNTVKAVDLTPDGIYAICGLMDKHSIFFDAVSGQVLKSLKWQLGCAKSVSITHGGRFVVSSSNDYSCILWNIESGVEPLIIGGRHTNWVKTIKISPNKEFAISGSWDKTCIKWNLKDGQSNKLLKGGTGKIDTINITSDSKRVITGSENSVNIWDLESGLLIRTLNHKGKVWTTDITPDDKRIISASQNSVNIWDLESGKEVITLKGHTSEVYTIRVTSDGKLAISGSLDEKCIIWDMENGTPYKILQGHTGPVIDIAITPDGKIALSGSMDNTCILWDIKSGEKLTTMRGHTMPITAISFSSDGKTAISSSEDKTCIVWDLNSYKVLNVLKGHSNSINAICISPDGKRVITGSSDKTCILWDIEKGNIISRFITVSNIHDVGIFSKGIIGCGVSGETFFLQTKRELLIPDFPITTVNHIWDFELNRYHPLSADCPLCGHRFPPTKKVLNTINKITKKAGLTPHQSPCLELPDEAWEQPGLLSECPKCKEKLKFNPFIAGEYKTNPKWKFWKR